MLNKDDEEGGQFLLKLIIKEHCFLWNPSGLCFRTSVVFIVYVNYRLISRLGINLAFFACHCTFQHSTLTSNNAVNSVSFPLSHSWYLRWHLHAEFSQRVNRKNTSLCLCIVITGHWHWHCFIMHVPVDGMDLIHSFLFLFF